MTPTFSHRPEPQSAPRRGSTVLTFLAPPLPTPDPWDLIDTEEE